MSLWQTAFAETSQETAALVRQGLSTVSTRSDSIRILYDVFDLLPRKDRIEVGRELYNVARRDGNIGVQLDICRLLSVCFDDDKNLKMIQDEVESLPPSQERDETILFLEMRRISQKARNLSEEDRQKEIVKVINEYQDHKSHDKNHEILELYTLVEFLRNDASGDMLKEYLEGLYNMVSAPEVELYAVENIVYSEAANIYSDAGDYEKAIAANKKMLEVIDNLEKEYQEKGRSYRNYDVSRYVAYRRMLRNAKGLKPGESEKYYRMAMQLAENNADVRHDVETNPRIHAYYYMAIGDYNSALPYLKEVSKRYNTLPTSKQFLEMLILASEKTGDRATHEAALEKYVSILQELAELKAAEKSRELQIRYDLQDLKARNRILEVENKEKEIENARRIMVFVTVAFVILFLALVVMLFNWARYRRNASRMGKVVDNMHNERHRLRNSLYSDGYDLDPMAQEDEREAHRWERRMKLAGESRRDATIFMTESIVNDLLYIAASGHGRLLKYMRHESLHSILRQVETHARENEPDAELLVRSPEEDYKIYADTECLVNLLGHMFGVAANYSPISKVEIECKRSGQGHVEFVITIYGVGAAAKEGPQVFHNMPVSNILLNHQDSGLYICRMISMLLQCVFRPDMTYKEGARYTLRVPEKLL